MTSKRQWILDYPVDVLPDFATGVQQVFENLFGVSSGDRDTSKTAHVVTLNPEMIMAGEQNPELAAILKNAELILPDGAGIVWALKVQGISAAKRLPGIEFAEAMLASMAQKGLGVAIIGAQPDVLAKAVEKLKHRYAGLNTGINTGLNIVYTHHGFFQSDEEMSQVAQACAATRPALVLVALGVPKQEQWIARYRKLFKQTVFIGVGGSLDVWSGVKKRAPWLFRQFHLEWLYRITSEPWRIRRTYKPLPMFVVKVLQARFFI